jgi:hypothetical protein
MKLAGHLDLCGPTLIEGWIYCDLPSRSPIVLQVFVGDLLLGECTADRTRHDLEDAGYGDGRCGFSFEIPEKFVNLSFKDTKLRLLDAPVFMLPSDSTLIAD